MKNEEEEWRMKSEEELRIKNEEVWRRMKNE
jgi:hypothetical protein